ncbi:WD40-repeat-containing domain protein [Gorgonomyces haynaldii]|nr:WD40-repeat-containing domain protein [Gorgonomyces haynaldii]
MSRIHFGSLERSVSLSDNHEPQPETVADHTTNRAMMEQDEQESLLAKKKLVYNISVPTDDHRVREILRDLQEPVTYFGENNGLRRTRLKELLAELAAKGEDISVYLEDQNKVEEDEEQTEEFYTYGPPELQTARREILGYSVPQAIARREMHRKELRVPFGERKKLRHDLYTRLMDYQSDSLQFGDDRPMGFCCFSPNAKLLATAAWSGLIKLWTVPGSDLLRTFKGHKDRVSGIAFHPQSTVHQGTKLDFASGSTDGSVYLWSLGQETPLGSLVGHQQRVARLAFHPSGRYIGTASFDTSWRLWDAETTQELLLQEGHSKEVFAIGFQGDGALAATGGLDSVGRVWDLRSGRSIMVLRSHIKPILTLDWSPNGYQLVTAGEDNAIKVWDVRQQQCIYTIPAHTNIISQVKFWHATDAFESDKYKDWSLDNPVTNEAMQTDDNITKQQLLDGSFLVSSSYDGTCKLWTDGDYKPIRSLSGVEGKVMCTDISGDGKYIVTALYDRTFKIYAAPSL